VKRFSVRKTIIHRRTVLRGLVGGAAIGIGLPPLEAMFNGNGTAYAQGAPIPKRLGVFFWGNGVKLDRWTPANTGTAWTPSLELAPLMPVKDYVNVVSGMAIKTGNERGHHAGTVGILSGAPMISEPHPNSAYASTFSAPSIDQVAANVIGTTTRFKSLEVGISKRLDSVEGTTLHYLSHNGPDSANPPEYDPSAVFNRIFGTGFTPPGMTPTMPVVDVSMVLKKSVLDAVLGDITALKAKVGTADGVRLDQHMENVRSIENRLTTTSTPGAATQAMCAVPGTTTLPAETSSKEAIAERMTAMSSLITMALACDQTRVFSIMFSGSVNGTVFWEIGATGGHHDLTHNEADPQPTVHAATIFTMQQFTTLLSSLKAVSEGAGNLLDSCAILASSCVADGKQHSITDYPILVAGRAGGKLTYPSVHYRSPSGENASMVLMSMLQAVGVPLTTFGLMGGMVSSGLSAIQGT
jgi:Protein of unknown function (DUF1552)